jgi:hypothetical protein
VFYATVYIKADRVSIRFIFMGQQQRLTREGIAELFQVDLHDGSIHYLAYPDVEPPRCAHSRILPSDEDISFMFQQYQESQQVILEGIYQQQEAQRQQMLQHQMLNSQMFTFMPGCLGQLFQQSGLQLPQPPTTAEQQADPTAPLPPAGGFVNVALAIFPQSPLLQTWAFAAP